MGFRNPAIASVRKRQQNRIGEVENEIRQSAQSVTRDVQEIHRASLRSPGFLREDYFEHLLSRQYSQGLH